MQQQQKQLSYLACSTLGPWRVWCVQVCAGLPSCWLQLHKPGKAGEATCMYQSVPCVCV